MQQLIAERVAIVAMAAPRSWGEDELENYIGDDWRWNPIPAVDQLTAEACEAMGYLQGVADAADLTILELLDAVTVRVADVLRLVRRADVQALDKALRTEKRLSRPRGSKQLPAARPAKVAARKPKS